MATFAPPAVLLEQPNVALCCARTTRACPTPTYSGPTWCPYSCPVPVCPVHHDDTQLYCTYQCFLAAHPSAPRSPPLAPPTHAPAAHVSSTTDAGSLYSSRSLTRAGKYTLGETLGQGSFGTVRLGEDSSTGTWRAIKVIDRAKVRAAGMGEQIKREIRVMRELQHDNIVQLVEVLASSTSIFLVLELVTGGELFDVIVQKGRLEEDEARRYFRQLVSGLSYCHERGVCHRDLKPENLLLDDKGVLKISDFGLATKPQRELKESTDIAPATNDAAAADSSTPTMPSRLSHTLCGTPNYVAPEVLMDLGYDGMAADVWSAGVILYVLLAGFLPFDEESMVDLFRKIMKAEFSYPAWFSADAKHLLSQLLTPKVEERATMQQILQHPWLTEPTKQAEKQAEEQDEEEEVELWETGDEQDSEWRDDDLEAQEGEEDTADATDETDETDWNTDSTTSPLSTEPSTDSTPSLTQTSTVVESTNIDAQSVFAQFYANKTAAAEDVRDDDSQFAMGQFYAETDPESLFGNAAYDPELYVTPSPRPRATAGSDGWDWPSSTSAVVGRGNMERLEAFPVPPAALLWDTQDETAAELVEADLFDGNSSGDDHVGGDTVDLDLTAEVVNQPMEQLINSLEQLDSSSSSDASPAELAPGGPSTTQLDDIDSSATSTSPRRRRMSDPGDVRLPTWMTDPSTTAQLDLHLSFSFTSLRTTATTTTALRPSWSFYKFRFNTHSHQD